MNRQDAKNTGSRARTTANTTAGEPLILALDTSSAISSIAIARGDRIMRTVTGEADRQRSERLWVEIDVLLGEVGSKIIDVGLFAVCVGPGGFTGLRVGIAAVKGLGFATGKPVVGVTSLEVIAFAAGQSPAVCSIIPGYGGDVYSQVFEVGSDGIPAPVLSPVVSPPATAIERVGDRDSVIFAGDAAVAYVEMIRERAGDRFRPWDSRSESASGWFMKPAMGALADHIAQLAFLKYSRGEAGSAESLRACYVRPAEAEVKLRLGLVGTKIRRLSKKD